MTTLVTPPGIVNDPDDLRLTDKHPPVCHTTTFFKAPRLARPNHRFHWPGYWSHGGNGHRTEVFRFRGSKLDVSR